MIILVESTKQIMTLEADPEQRAELEKALLFTDGIHPHKINTRAGGRTVYHARGIIELYNVLKKLRAKGVPIWFNGKRYEGGGG